MTLSKLLAQYEVEMGIVCDRKRCTRQATHIVTWHVMDFCNEEPDRIFLLCAACAKDTVARYRVKVMEMKDALHQQNSSVSLECTTCGRRVDKLSKVCKMQRLTYRLNVESVGE
jgi:hypothetical protein